MKDALQVVEAHAFEARDFISGDPALDFVNTVTGRDGKPRDWLDSYARLLEWAGRAELLSAKMLRTLARKAESQPAAAARALVRAKTLREALYALLAAIAAGRAPPKESLALLREGWIAGTEAHELRFEDGRVVSGLRGDDPDLDLVAAVVAYRLVEHVLPSPADRLRVCAGPDCSWVFLDRSKSGRRRWCDMAVCGNAAKSRRHYARVRAGR